MFRSFAASHTKFLSVHKHIFFDNNNNLALITFDALNVSIGLFQIPKYSLLSLQNYGQAFFSISLGSIFKSISFPLAKHAIMTF